jgi:hypothetical protein
MRRLAASKLSVLLAALATPPTSWADPVLSMQQCRLIMDSAVRVACYDAIPLSAITTQSKGAPAPIAAAGTTSRGIEPAPRTAAAPTAVSFGLPVTASTQPVNPVANDALESRIAGAFEGWQAGSKLRLVNGQVWQINDDSEGVYALRDPKVLVTRGRFGGYFMQIEGISQSPRVRRVE